MRFEKSPQLPGAGRTWAGYHHGSQTPTSTGAILLSKMACQPNILAASVQATQHLISFCWYCLLTVVKHICVG